MFKKYQIVLANLDPKDPSVQAGVRPCVIVQSNLFNPYSPSFIIVPLTSNCSKKFPNEFFISPSKLNGLTEESRFLGSQVMTISDTRIIKTLGELESQYRSELLHALSLSFDFSDEF